MKKFLLYVVASPLIILVVSSFWPMLLVAKLSMTEDIPFVVEIFACIVLEFLWVATLLFVGYRIIL